MYSSRNTNNNDRNFELLCAEDRMAIDRYRSEIQNSGLKNTSQYLNVINTLVDYLVTQTDTSLNKWDKDAVELFLGYGEWSPAYIRVMKKVLSGVFEALGIQMDMSNVSPLKNGKLSESLTLNFSQLTDITKGLDESDGTIFEHPDCLNKNSSPIAAIYLSWIGLGASEIADLKKKDVNLTTGTVVTGDSVYPFGNYPEIVEYFYRYVNADKFALILSKKTGSYTMLRPHCESESFIKKIKSGTITGQSINGMVKNACGRTPGSFLLSGRLDRLYQYELNGGVISTDNSRNIAEIARIPFTKSNYAVIELLKKYDTYKEKRSKTFE